MVTTVTAISGEFLAVGGVLAAVLLIATLIARQLLSAVKSPSYSELIASAVTDIVFMHRKQDLTTSLLNRSNILIITLGISFSVSVIIKIITILN